MISTRDKQRCVWWFGFLCVAAVLGGYCITIGFRGMPPTEGWYTWYAELINNDSVVYRDFSYLFYPFYIQFISFFCSIFGYNILALRILGLILFVAIGIACYLLFSKLVNVPGAAIAAIATTMYLQSEVVQLFYDYIRFFDLFAYLSIYFLVSYMIDLAKNQEKKFSLSIIFSAVFATLACMTKQSTGTLLIVYTIILLLFSALVLDKKRSKKILFDTLCYFLVVFFMFAGMFIWLLVNGAAGAFLKNATGDALGAKGGLVNLLFRWIVNLYPSMLKQIFPAIGLLSCLALVKLSSCIHIRKNEELGNSEVLLNKKTDGIFGKSKADYVENLALLGCGALVIGALIVVCRKFHGVTEYFSNKFDVNMSTFGFVLCTLCFAFIGFSLLFLPFKIKKYPDKEKIYNRILVIFPWFSLLGAIFAIGYGSGLSGGLCESQTALVVGFIIALSAKALENSKIRIVGTAVLIIYGASFSASCASRKYLNTYSWWGLSEGPVWEEQFTAKSPMLAGIKMNQYEKEMYDGVLRIIEEYTNKNDSIFCFPHIPIFYSLTNRGSDTYTQVQWFDVSNIKDIERDIDTLKKSPPKAIIYCSLPEFVYSSHESMFNNNEISQTRIMSDFLLSLVEDNDYELVGAYHLCDGYAVSVYVQ